MINDFRISLKKVLDGEPGTGIVAFEWKNSTLSLDNVF